MSRTKKIVSALLATPLVLALLFVVIVGPWPSYKDSQYQSQDYYQEALADIATHAAFSEITATPAKLQAGWAKRKFTPEPGAPMGGYSGRGNDKKSIGVRDDLYVRALALSDGRDTVVLVGSDMLIIPPNISAAVREGVAARNGLTGDQILFNASHTHCGPGGFMPGIISTMSGGEYDPTLIDFIVANFVDAIVEAQEHLEPASLASGSVQAPEYIRNRARDGGPVDPELSFMVAKQDDGDVCYVASYSAHPTIFGGDMLEFSAEYPGELMRSIEKETSHDAQYLGGAVGSMGPRAPEAPTDSERVTAMGQALAGLILANDDTLEFSDHLDIAAAGVPIGMPHYQLRPMEDNVAWRLSPVLPGLLGLERQGWIHGVRVGKLFFVGMPFDVSGESSVVWKTWAEGQGLDLWTLSFCSTYCGYLSPDKYYTETPLGYETGMMSWYGPNVEAYFTELFHALVQHLSPNTGATTLG